MASFLCATMINLLLVDFHPLVLWSRFFTETAFSIQQTLFPWLANGTWSRLGQEKVFHIPTARGATRGVQLGEQFGRKVNTTHRLLQGSSVVAVMSGGSCISRCEYGLAPRSRRRRKVVHHYRSH